MPEIKVNITFDIDGTDKFQGVFKKPYKDLESLDNALKKVAGGVGKISVEGQKIKLSADVKQAASYAEKYVASLIKAKGLTGRKGALMYSGIQGAVKRDETGTWGMKGKQTVRKTEAFGGQGQLAFAEELRKHINNTYLEINRKFKTALSKIPAEVDSAGFATSMSKELRTSQAMILSQYRKAVQGAEGMTGEAGNNIRQLIRELHTKIVGGIQSFVGRAGASQAGAENLGNKISDFRQRFATEIDMVAKATGGKLPESVTKIKAAYDQFLATKEQEINEERRKGALTRANASEYMDTLKRVHGEMLSAVRSTATQEIASRKALGKSAATDYKVDTYFQDSLNGVFQKVAKITTGIRIDPEIAGRLGTELNARLLAVQREMVVAYDRLKANAGGIADAGVEADIKTKIRDSLNRAVQPFVDSVKQVGTQQDMGRSLSEAFLQMRFKIANSIAMASKAFEGGTPAGMTKIRENLGVMLAGLEETSTGLAATGKLTKTQMMEIKARADLWMSEAIAGINKISTEHKKGLQEATNAAKKSANEQIRLENYIANEKYRMASLIQKTINRQIASARLEYASANMLKKPVIAKSISSLQQMLRELTMEVEKAAPKTKEEVKRMVESINNKLLGGVTDVKMKKVQAPGTAIGGMLFNRATVQSFAAVMGHMMTQVGDQIVKMAESTRLKGQLTSGVSDLFMSAFMTSKFLIFNEIAKIGAGVVEIFINILTELPRQLMELVGGFISSIGGALKAGLATSMWLALTAGASAAAAGVTAGLSVVVGIVTGALLLIQALLKGLGNFISSFLSSLLQAIYSVIKAGVMIISSIVKGLVETVKGLMNGLYEGLKSATAAFMEFMKASWSALGAFVKQSIQEYASQVEFATRAYKETVGIAGQSIEAFQKLMLSLRTGFAFKKEDAGEAVFDIISSGFRDIAEAQKLVAASGTLAVASTSSLSTSVNAMITAWQNFSGSGETVDSIMKSINGAVVLGRMTMEEFGTSLKSVMGLASRLGLTFADTVGSLAMMTRVFGRGSIEESTKYFNRFLEAIYMPSTRASKSVAGLGVNVEKLSKGSMRQGIFEIVEKLKDMDLKDVNKIFTTIQSRRAWLGLTKDVEQFKKLLEEMGPVSQGVGWQLQQMMETPERMLGRLRESFSAFQYIVGEQLWKTVVDGMRRFVEWTQKMINLLQTDRIRNFFAEFVKWVTPIVNTVFKPLLDFLDRIYLFINRGFGKGNDFAKMFQTEAAVRLQQAIINTVENVKALAMWMVNVVKNAEIVKGVWDKIKSVVGDVFKYFESTTWQDWIADVLNFGAKIKAMFENIFLGTDIGWFQKVVNEIFGIIVKGIQSIGRILQMTMMPIFDRMMALVGVKLKNSIIRGFLDAIDFMASKLEATGMFGPLAEQLRKVVLQANAGLRGGRGRGGVETMQMGQMGAGKGYSEMMKGYFQAQAGNVKTALKYGLGPIGQLFGVKGGGGDWMAGLGKVIEGAIKNRAGGAELPVMTRGMMAARTEKEMAVLSDLMQKYAPSILAAIDDMPMKMKLTGKGKYGYEINVGDITKDLKRLISPEGLRGADADTRGMAADLFDIFVTQLSNLSSPTFRKAAGLDEPTIKNSGLANLLDILGAMSNDYVDTIDSMTYVNADLKNSIPKVKEELVNFAKELGMSSKKIGGLFSGQWKGLNKPFSPQQFQNVVGGKEDTGTGAVDALNLWERLRAEYDRTVAQQTVKSNNVNSALIGKILDILDRIDAAGIKIPEFMTYEGREKFRANLKPGANFATEFLNEMSKATGEPDEIKYLEGLVKDKPGLRDMVKELKTTPDYANQMLADLSKLTEKAFEIKNKMDEIVKKFGTQPDLVKKAKQEEEKAYQTKIQNMTDEDLEKEYQSLKKELQRDKVKGTSADWEQKAAEAQRELGERQVRYKEYTDTAPIQQMNFEDWQQKQYGNVRRQSEIDLYKNIANDKKRNESTRMGNKKKLDEIIKEAAHRRAKGDIKEETKKKALEARTPEEQEKVRLEGEQKIRDLEKKRVDDEITKLEPMVTKGTATPDEKKRLEALKLREAELARQQAAADTKAREKAAAVARNAAAEAADKAIVEVRDAVVDQLVETRLIRDITVKQATNVATLAKQVGNIGTLMTSTPSAPADMDKFRDYFSNTISDVV